MGSTPRFIEQKGALLYETVFHSISGTGLRSEPVGLPEEQAAAKPVIYLYPEKETTVTVKLDYAGALTCTYPAYGDGWTVTACPDGTLTDNAGQDL